MTLMVSGLPPGALEASSALSMSFLISEKKTLRLASALLALLFSPSRPLDAFNFLPLPPAALLGLPNFFDEGDDVKLSMGARIR